MAMPLRHPGSLMTLDEWVVLPEDNTYRYDLQEGGLLVSPRAARRHRLAAQRLSQQLDGQLPADWESVLDMEMVVRAEYPPSPRWLPRVPRGDREPAMVLGMVHVVPRPWLPRLGALWLAARFTAGPCTSSGPAGCSTKSLSPTTSGNTPVDPRSRSGGSPSPLKGSRWS
jgi:hypothetical protein